MRALPFALAALAVIAASACHPPRVAPDQAAASPPPPAENASCVPPSGGDFDAPTGTLYSDAMPPVRFRRAAVAMLQTASPEDVQRFCDQGPPTCGYVTEACTTELEGHDQRGKKLSTSLLTMPNPCGFPASDEYAHLLCHELGHVNGWPENHGP